jgi:alkanesulfonate monooxygenase SsuD/methylene tetrahydromethanopterin reductase-like flavin-dependent oxidoreductase (luciferase family)
VGHRGFVLPGNLDHSTLGDLAAQVEQSGYEWVWITVIGADPSPASLMHAALAATSTIQVGLGVIPLDRFTGDDIAREAVALGVTPQRSTFGFGVGQAYSGAAQRMQEQLTAFHVRAPELSTAVGTYSAGVLRVAGSLGSSLVLNWMTPSRAAWALEQTGSDASSGAPAAYVYVSAAHGPDAQARIAQSMQAFGTTAHHRRNQQAMDLTRPIGIAAESAADVEAALCGYWEDPRIVPVINPIGQLTVGDRVKLIEFFRPTSVS